MDAATVASDIVERPIRVSRARATASRGRRASTIMTAVESTNGEATYV
jgi:hypothetical protein